MSNNQRGVAPSKADGPNYRFGFDIGGTFTDFVLIDASTG